MGEHWRDVVAVVAILGTWGTVVKLFFGTRDRVKQVELSVAELRKMHIACNAQQSTRSEESRERMHSLETAMITGLGDIKAEVSKTGQKLDDLIKFTKNGGGK